MSSHAQFDVFLAHNSQDKPHVRAIANELKKRGLKVWLDEEQMYGGDTPYREIENGLYNSKCVVFFIGSSGSGRWQGNLELPITVDLVIHSNIRLIPVLLPSITEIPAEENYRFLRTKFSIDFERIDNINTLTRLYESICRSGRIEIKSEKKVDYTRLRNLLEAGEWQEADAETLAVMLKASGREAESYLDYQSIANFPCTDLRTIDQLWIKYSNGRFGFSVQKRIWESAGGNPDADYETYYQTYCKFGDRVGWRVDNEWISYPEDVVFGTKAPEGHLPIFTPDLEIVPLPIYMIWGCVVSSLAQRLVKSNI